MEFYEKIEINIEGRLTNYEKLSKDIEKNSLTNGKGLKVREIRYDSKKRETVCQVECSSFFASKEELSMFLDNCIPGKRKIVLCTAQEKRGKKINFYSDKINLT